MKYIALIFLILSIAAISGEETSNLRGKVVDSSTFLPVENCRIEINESEFTAITNSDGVFLIRDVSAGLSNIEVARIGYHTYRDTLILNPMETVDIRISLDVAPLEMEGVSTKSKFYANKHQPVIEVSGERLHQELSQTIAATLVNQPGLDQRSMGPAPSRPVLRGLSGDRLMIMEDGNTTGDLSASSADHAVVIEPISAEGVEIIRGPQSLIFASNSTGGVINVKKGYIPLVFPEKIQTILMLQGETVNQGITGGIKADIPVDNYAIRLAGSLRRSKSIISPAGKLKNTEIYTENVSTGISYFPPWGNVGTAISYYYSDYGIPGGFEGGHPNGVTIRMERKHLENKTEMLFTGDIAESLEINYRLNEYHHAELERSDLIGVSFNKITGTFSADLWFRSGRLFTRSMAGTEIEYVDYDIGGLSFSPDLKQYNMSGYLYGEIPLPLFDLKSSLRGDYRIIDPDDNEEGVNNEQVGLIRKRIFQGISASLSFEKRVNRFTVGSTVTRTMRFPLPEELYSQGPHLAAYSYEVGNADLETENCLSTELFMDYQFEKSRFNLTAFRNYFHNYIFADNTGETEWSLLLPVYKYQGRTVEMLGMEGSYDIDIGENLSLNGGVSYVEAKIQDSNSYLPEISPLKGILRLKYSQPNYSVGLESTGACRQDKLGEFEDPTAAYLVWNVSGSYILQFKKHKCVIDLKLENIFDTEYRRHLSRVKSIMPEPGFNFKILTKYYF